MGRYLDVWDKKWAHPEIAEFCYQIPNHDEVSGYNYLKTASYEEREQFQDNYRGDMRKIFDETCPEQEKEQADWIEFFTEHGCPEEKDAKAVRLLVRIPKDVREKEKLPVIYFIPGGGLICGGTPEAGMMLPTNLIHQGNLRTIVVLPEYRLAPNHPYPAAINDCHAGYLWMLEHKEELHIDDDRILLSGGSTGGHLCLSLAFRLKRYGYHGKMPRGVLPLIPVLDDGSADVASNRLLFTRDNGIEDCWDARTARQSFKWWLGEAYGDPTLSPEAIPSKAKLEDVQGYPPVWFVSSAELDSARDFVYRFATLLGEAGIFCEVHMWGACSHASLVGTEGRFLERVGCVGSGAFKDAMEYDFRRQWLNE